MTQQDVLKFLEKNPDKWFTAKEINKKLKFKCASSNLNKLNKQGYVFKKVKQKIYQRSYYKLR